LATSSAPIRSTGASAEAPSKRGNSDVLAFLTSGITNADSGGTNRVIKTVARDADGFCNPDNQRLRTEPPPPDATADTSTPLNFEEPTPVADHYSERLSGRWTCGRRTTCGSAVIGSCGFRPGCPLPDEVATTVRRALTAVGW
jgi:hypothetical protein